MGELFGPLGYIFNLIFTFPIFNALMLLYHLFGDFALSIIVLTVIIRLILVPLTLQSLKSTKAMQTLQPRLAEIKKKHGSDQQAQLAETQKLYKEAGVNPVAGCFPMLLQMPVLYGLYFAIGHLIQTTVGSNGQLPSGYFRTINSLLYPFVPHFVANPDLNLNWFTFLNPAWHISLIHPQPALAILAGLATFVQLRMSQPKPTGAKTTGSDPSAQSMKMMQYFMPVMIAIFGWSVAAGLALYWTVSSVFQAVQQYFVTGWGSLGSLVPPSLVSSLPAQKSSPTVVEASNGKRRASSSERQTDADEKTSDDTRESAGARRGPVSSQLRTSTRPTNKGNSQTNRRSRSTSASARRRGSTQKSHS